MAMKSGIAVIAIGGNALIAGPSRRSTADQAQIVTEICRHIADMVDLGWRIAVTHGSGPQVGFVLRQSELGAGEVPPVPLHVAAAEVQGAIGFLFQHALNNELHRRGRDAVAVALVTQIEVSRADPAFAAPAKPIGSYMEQAVAQEHAARHGWTIHETPGRGWRRVVASPRPSSIVEMPALRGLLAGGHLVIACGGGGIPVVRDEAGLLTGVDAVIDKDHASALLAREIGAKLFVNLTEVDGVALNFGEKNQRWLDRLSVTQARAYLREGQFPPGSMGPKVEAMIAHLEAGGESGVIAGAGSLGPAMAGESGTWFYPG